ncbi:LPXTG cell wall anchor domain-containing protein [Tenacibaculum maritimum]|uniref:LPXTG cell wall anchor domain-containing protein n=1 Tax=Tenacibaculum maritimum TaxID=107401 RepID=UPI00387762EA
MYLKIENQETLGGWFNGFCPSNGIARRLNAQSKGVWAQHDTYKKKLESLKNGREAAQWENLKKEVRKLDEELKELNRDLEKERAIASAIGVDMTGLGAWCNGAVSKRKKAEASLREAEKALGTVKGAMTTLKNQQTYGIKEASRVVLQNQQKIEAVKNEIKRVQDKIELYKAERENERKEVANNETDKNSATKSDIVGKLKENALPIIGGLALLTAGVLYMRKKKKRTVKKVKA